MTLELVIDVLLALGWVADILAEEARHFALSSLVALLVSYPTWIMLSALGRRVSPSRSFIGRMAVSHFIPILVLLLTVYLSWHSHVLLDSFGEWYQKPLNPPLDLDLSCPGCVTPPTSP